MAAVRENAGSREVAPIVTNSEEFKQAYGADISSAYDKATLETSMAKKGLLSSDLPPGPERDRALNRAQKIAENVNTKESFLAKVAKAPFRAVKSVGKGTVNFVKKHPIISAAATAALLYYGAGPLLGFAAGKDAAAAGISGDWLDRFGKAAGKLRAGAGGSTLNGGLSGSYGGVPYEF